MNNFKRVILVLIILFSSIGIKAAPSGRNVGFGIMIGEPTGLTLKVWTANDAAWAFSIGNSYLGRFRIGADYLWHFNAFNSSVVNLYAGPGLAIGIGESGGWWYHDSHDSHDKWYRTNNNDIGLGVRGVFGINVMPRRTPLEIFGEFGVMVGVLPATYTNVEGAFGIRFYF